MRAPTRTTKTITIANEIARCAIRCTPSVAALAILSPVIVPTLAWKSAKHIIKSAISLAAEHRSPESEADPRRATPRDLEIADRDPLQRVTSGAEGGSAPAPSSSGLGAGVPSVCTRSVR